MVVKHNLTAMNSNRMLGITTKSQAKATEKLSSGYKINRAADDAAGLAISEKMRKQIRGLTQASLNAQDGISAVQTAEGALTEVHDMIQRMSELAVKAANGTNSKEERDYIQLEVDQLVSEINRVAETTKFSDLYLLKGGTASTTVNRNVAGQEGTPEVPPTVTYKPATAKEVVAKDPDNFGDDEVAGLGWYASGSDDAVEKLEDLLDFVEVGQDVDGNDVIQFKNGKELFTQSATDGQDHSQQVSINDLKTHLSIDGGGDKIYTDEDGKNEVAESDLAKYLNYDGTFKDSEKTTLYDKDGNALDPDTFMDIVDFTAGEAALPGTPASTTSQSVSAMEFKLHVGAESADTNKISVTIAKMDSATLFGAGGVDVSSEDAATKTIDELNAGLRIVSEQRATLGAVQNRLEHTINNLDNVVENTTAAESQIRDTDMATQMVTYANNQILAQAGQAMLAQSNQANQGVLSLLQ